MTNFEEFYAAYPNKQDRDRCKGYYKKISAEEHDEIMLALDAHKRWRKEAEKAGEFVPTWCNCATWIYRKRYRDHLPCSTSELKEKSKSVICAVEGCEEPVHAPKSSKPFCYHHWSYDENGKLRGDCLQVAELRAEFKRLGSVTDRAECLKIIYAKNPAMAARLNRN